MVRKVYKLGNDCQYPICFGLNSTDSNVCNNNGVCISPNNCICNKNYTGKFLFVPIGIDCSSPTCNGLNSTDVNICNRNGNCTSLNKCTCNSNYTGNQ